MNSNRRRNAKDPDRRDDVLEALLAHIDEDCINFAAHMIERRARDADAARLRDAFEARSDVDAVAKNVVALDKHVTEIDADAEQHALLLADARISLRHKSLY